MMQQALFHKIDESLLTQEHPSEFLKELLHNPAFLEYPFSLLAAQATTKQSPIHHPEGSVWNHTLLVVDQAAEVKHRSRDKRVLMWAAFLHDIGKPSTTKVRKGKITSYDHDKEGETLAREFLAYFEQQQGFIDAVAALVRYHMQLLFVVKSMPFQDIDGILKNTDPEELALLGYCDRMGRTHSVSENEQKTAKLFLEKIAQWKRAD